MEIKTLPTIQIEELMDEVKTTYDIRDVLFFDGQGFIDDVYLTFFLDTDYYNNFIKPYLMPEEIPDYEKVLTYLQKIFPNCNEILIGTQYY